MVNEEEIEVVDLEEFLLSQGIDPYLKSNQDEVEVVDLEQFLLEQGINPYIKQEEDPNDILLDEITLDNGTKKYVDHATFREYITESLKQAKLKRQEAAAYRKIVDGETNIPIEIIRRQEQAAKTNNELSDTLDELRGLTKNVILDDDDKTTDSSTLKNSEKKSSETEGISNAEMPKKMVKFKNRDGSISDVTEDEFNIRILENVIEAQEIINQMRKRRQERAGKSKIGVQENQKEPKSSREIAIEILSNIKQDPNEETRNKKEVSSASINSMSASQKISTGKNASIEDLSNFLKEMQDNNPLRKQESTDFTSKEEKNYNNKKKKKKKKKHYLKGAAVAASLILGLIIPGKRTNESDVAIIKNTTIESQVNNDVKENVKPQETNNNTGNKIVVNNKVVKDTLKNKIKITDKITLKKATFHYSSTGAGPKVSQSNIPCDSYSIEKFAILSSNNELIDTIDIDKNNKNMSIDDLKANIKSVYGEDVKIEMNVTGIEDGKETYPKIGWTSINKVSGTAKTYGKKR